MPLLFTAHFTLGDSMKQYNFIYYDIRKLINNISSLKDILQGSDPRKAILHIYVSGFSKKHIEVALKYIDKSLGNICKIGISEFPSHRSQNNCYININLIISDGSCFDYFYLNGARGEEKNIASDFINQIRCMDDIKAFEICSANHLTNAPEFIETLGAEYPNIPIFGSLSKPARIQNNKAVILPDAFFIGDKVYTEGYYIVVYSGKNLKINLNYIQNWRAIGKELNLKMEQHPIIGASLVTEIDNNPAIDVYKKYLGIPNDNNFLKCAWYFPLLIKRKNVSLCFTPIGASGKNIYYSGRIYDNEIAHFAYCTREDILHTSFDECKRIKTFQPEALMLIICCNRYAFMGDDEKRELDYYADCVSGMCYCHAFSEIAYINNKGGVLNSSLISISMREGPIDNVENMPFFFVI